MVKKHNNECIICREELITKNDKNKTYCLYIIILFSSFIIFYFFSSIFYYILILYKKIYIIKFIC